MRRLAVAPLIVLVPAAALVLSTPARAATILVAQMTPLQEVPPVVTFTTVTGAPRPASFGNATFTLNDAQTALVFTATIYNIDVTGTQTPDTNDNLAAAHIHAPAPPGVNAGVRWGFFGAPFNDTNPNDIVVTPFAMGVGGTFTSKWDALEGNNTTLALQIPNILAGLSYINFHTTQNPGGEIRGQITPVPEPASLLLIGTGLATLAARRRRR